MLRSCQWARRRTFALEMPVNLQTMYERGTATSDQRRQLDLEYQPEPEDWARLQGRGPHTAGAGHGRNRHWHWHRDVGWQEQ